MPKGRGWSPNFGSAAECKGNQSSGTTSDIFWPARACHSFTAWEVAVFSLCIAFSPMLKIQRLSFGGRTVGLRLVKSSWLQFCLASPVVSLSQWWKRYKM